MKVTLKLFAAVRDIVGESSLELEITQGTAAEDLWERLVTDHPALAVHRMPMVAVNQEYAAPDRVLDEGDEIAFIPPVSGG